MLCAENFKVHTAANGHGAIDYLAKFPVDLIVCDIMMPQMSGFELHQYLRSRPEFSHIPFVFLTALSGDEDLEKGHESGADDYVTKPFDPKQLVSIIKGKFSRGQLIKKQTEEKYENYRKKVLHTLSHEFRTPLVAINTGTELLLEHKHFDEDKIKNLLEAIHRGGQRLEKLVSDFMLLQQIEAGVAARMHEGHAKLHSVDALFNDIQSHVQPLIREARFSLSIEREPITSSVLVYSPQVLDVMERIVTNAVKFSKTEQHISLGLSMEPNGTEIRIAVRDRGVGMDPERMREAINLFAQLDRDKMEQQGSGIGLAIAARYAELHKGRLDFEQRPGGGSIVSLILPVAEI